MSCDVCVIGSGAGAAPIAATLARAGFRVVVLEKGPWLRTADFVKDEIDAVRRERYTPRLVDEPQVVEVGSDATGWHAWPTTEVDWSFWNGNLVGGATNLMSGFFHRLKPDDFRLRSVYGPVEGATVADWPLDYDALETWYDLVEREVGVSGRVVPHPHADRRSSPDFPFPPTVEHPLAQWIDQAGARLGLHPFPIPRAILSVPRGERASCAYLGWCGSYGCATGAKGSARAALLEPAMSTGNLEIRPRAMVYRLESDARGRVVAAWYFDADGAARKVEARVFVVAAQAIETARLLLMSPGPRHPNGLANGSDQVGRNLLFSTPGSGGGALPYAKFAAAADELKNPLPFVNRAFQDWYTLEDPAGGRRKGGTLDFLLEHPNPIGSALRAAFVDGRPVWGAPLAARLKAHFAAARHLRFEVFADWMPTADGRVTLDPQLKDRFGLPVSRVRITRHPRNGEVAEQLTRRGVEILKAMGAEEITRRMSGQPATNLVAGTCRFGKDPGTSVLDPDCRAHEAENLFVTDGSFMPTGGSVPYTWTIYANAFRVAEVIRRQL